MPISRVTITPQIMALEVWNKGFGYKWGAWQLACYELGKQMRQYMVDYINKNRKRNPKTWGKSIIQSIQLETVATWGGRVEWGIGNIGVLNANNPYWYVLNYGKKVSGEEFIPGGGKTVGGHFEGSAPRAGGSGQSFSPVGGPYAMTPKNPITPIPYIAATAWRLNAEVKRIIAAILMK